MQKLSLEDTKNLVDSYVQTFGQSGAAKKLTEIGYRSPTGSSILQAHIYRIMNGSSTCLLAPDQEDQQQEPSTTEEPIAAVPKRTKQIAEQLFEDEKAAAAGNSQNCSRVARRAGCGGDRPARAGALIANPGPLHCRSSLSRTSTFRERRQNLRRLQSQRACGI